MAHWRRICTYKIGDKSVLSDYTDDKKSDEDVIHLIHDSDRRRQAAEWFRNQVKDLSQTSDIALGYVLEIMPEFRSRISNLNLRWTGETFSILDN